MLELDTGPAPFPSHVLVVRGPSRTPPHPEDRVRRYTRVRRRTRIPKSGFTVILFENVTQPN